MVEKNKAILSQRPLRLDTSASDLLRLAKTNCPPLEPEKCHIRVSLTAHEDYTRLLASRLAELKAAEKEIEEEVRDIQEQTSTMRKILHPIRDLANEVLYEILILVIQPAIYRKAFRIDEETDEFGGCTSILSIRHPLWYLSHVCKQWRALLLGTPRLWTSICIPIPYHPLNTFSSAYVVRELVSRSGELPLNVSIVDHGNWVTESTALSELFAQSYRWKSFKLRTGQVGLTVLRSLPADFRCLEVLNIAAVSYRAPYADEDYDDYPLDWHDTLSEPEDYYDVETTRSIFPGVFNAPKLTSAVVCTPLHKFLSVCDLPWDQLTHAALQESRDAQSLFERISQMPSLVSGEFEFPAIVGTRRLAHATLKSLKLKVGHGDATTTLAALDLPTLASLDITRNQMSEGGHRLGPVAPSTGQSLRHLVITQFDIYNGDTPTLVLPGLLQSTPMLDSLEIMYPQHRSSTLNELSKVLTIRREDRNPLIPCLKDLIFRSTQGTVFNRASHDLITMIASRTGGRLGVSKIERILFETVGVVEEDVRQAFETLVAEGLDGGLREILQ